jgi:hypothetical protein
MSKPAAWFQAVGSLCFLSAGMLLATVVFSGCGGKSGDKKSASGNDDVRSQARKSGNDVRPPEAGDNVAAGGGHRGVWMNKGRKYYNKHPYDIWYPNAYQVAADRRPVGSAGNGKPVAVAPKNKADVSPVKRKSLPPAAGGWGAVISGAVLDAEMKRIANFCREKLLTAARYNTSFKDIRYNAAALSAVAQVAAHHPGSVPWKGDALYLRDLGLKLNSAATERGTTKFREAKETFEKIDDVLKKNKPAGLSEPNRNATFFDVASRGGLMRRMEAAHKWLKSEVKSEEQFKSKSQTIAHEAAILGLLVKVIGDKSYDSAEDAAYAKHVAVTLEETGKIVSATKTGNFAAYQPAVDKIYNQCNECHTAFRQ